MKSYRVGSNPAENPYQQIKQPTSNKVKISKSSQDLLLQASEEHFSRMLKLVRETIEKQGGLASGKLTVHVDVQVAFEKDIAENGYWSAEKTAERILDFARNLADNDPGKIGVLRDAVEKGFQEAEKILGGLPEISKRTLELVRQGFDDWAKEGK